MASTVSSRASRALFLVSALLLALVFTSTGFAEIGPLPPPPRADKVALSSMTLTMVPFTGASCSTEYTNWSTSISSGQTRYTEYITACRDFMLLTRYTVSAVGLKDTGHPESIVVRNDSSFFKGPTFALLPPTFTGTSAMQILSASRSLTFGFKFPGTATLSTRASAHMSVRVSVTQL